ncbi:MAG: endolytic transglycosylase MltG [Thermanaerothrix sp.]|nr:endolytic transglycosylase MltG [Thermanaerothrix sp.]
MKGKEWLFLSLGVILFLGFLAGLSFVMPSERWYQITREEKTPITVDIPQGSSARDVARILVNAGIVSDEAELLRWMNQLGFDRSIKPGSYKVEPGSPWEVAMRLRETSPEGRSITIVPGYDRVDLLKFFDLRTWELALKDDDSFFPPVKPILPDNPWDRLAFMAPDTYFVGYGDQAVRSLIRMASKAWWERVGVHNRGLTKERAMYTAVLASIVEREAKLDRERPLVASVFINRIHRGMPLQSCATVVYAWKLQGEKKTHLSFEDLKIESPYNTYSRKGLPPGPIGIPGIPSWNAALAPANSKFLFFRLVENGSHRFSETFDEHVRNGHEN